MTDETIEMDREEFRLLVDLAGAARNHRTGGDITPYMGGSHRRVAASRAHDKAKRLLREADNHD